MKKEKNACPQNRPDRDDFEARVRASLLSRSSHHPESDRAPDSSPDTATPILFSSLAPTLWLCRRCGAPTPLGVGAGTSPIFLGVFLHCLGAALRQSSWERHPLPSASGIGRSFLLNMRKVLGIDEAGRGPVIGPLVLAGVMLDESKINRILKEAEDSKKLSKVKREQLYKMSGKIVKTANITQSAIGNKDGLWTTVIAVAVFCGY